MSQKGTAWANSHNLSFKQYIVLIEECAQVKDGHLGSILLRWRPALVGVVLRGRGVGVGVGSRGRSRGVESSGLAPATKLLRLLVLHVEHHMVNIPLRFSLDIGS